jgi:hypothetical protein
LLKRLKRQVQPEAIEGKLKEANFARRIILVSDSVSSNIDEGQQEEKIKTLRKALLAYQK